MMRSTRSAAWTPPASAASNTRQSSRDRGRKPVRTLPPSLSVFGVERALYLKKYLKNLRGGLLQCLVDQRNEVCLARQADLLGENFAVLEQNHRRHGADAQAVHRLLVVLDVDRRDGQPARVLGGNLVDQRLHRLARAAPLSFELHEHGIGGAEHLLCEGGVGHRD